MQKTIKVKASTRNGKKVKAHTRKCTSSKSKLGYTRARDYKAMKEKHNESNWPTKSPFPTKVKY